jgi:hypothetical protein
MDWHVNVTLLLRIAVVLVTRMSDLQLGTITELEPTQTPVRELHSNVFP